MTRKVLTLKESIALATYCQEHWPNFERTVEAFAIQAGQALAIDRLNSNHVNRIVSELGLVKATSTPATVLARLDALEKELAELKDRIQPLLYASGT